MLLGFASLGLIDWRSSKGLPTQPGVYADRLPSMLQSHWQTVGHKVPPVDRRGMDKASVLHVWRQQVCQPISILILA